MKQLVIQKITLSFILLLCFSFLSINTFAQDPSAPKGLSISQGTNEFTLTWDNDPLATNGFNIYISEGATTQYITTIPAGSTSYTYTGTYGTITITDGNTYTATVQALPDADNNAYANSGAFVLNPTGDPSSPTGVSVTEGTNEFTLNWNNDPLATGGFNIYITEGATTEYITTVAAGSTSYTYTGTYGAITITDENTYTATVQALPDADNNAYANSGAFTLNGADPGEPSAPTGISVTQGTDEFTLNWDNDPLATNFNIYITENNVTKYVTTVAAGSTSYTYTGTLEGITIADGGTYSATVQALPDTDNNNYSNALVYTSNISEVTLSDADPDFHIYIAFGQSNMEGSAPIETVDFSSDSRFLSLQSLDCTNLNREKNKWYEATPPASQCFSQLSLVNSFGKNMIDGLSSGIKVGIINVAVGGSDIRLFDKDLYQDYDTSNEDPFFSEKIAAYGDNPYQHLINLALLAKQKGVIKGILLHQGEANADKTDTAQWPTYVQTVYNNMLSDLSLNAADVPLLAGEVGHTNNGGVVGSMNATIANLPSVIPTAHVISSDGCTLGSDNVHFNSAGVRELGRRYAVKMLDILSPTLSTNTPLNKVKGYKLNQNTPNPSLGETQISFEIPKNSKVTIDILDIHGKIIRKIVNNQNYNQGNHTITINTSNLTPGIYFYRMKTNHFSSTKKMLISK